MENNDLISVIVPVYKVEQYIKKCIDSILNQTYTNLEIILVDDGSPDESGKICDKYAEKDARIKVIHKANGGQATARNTALDIANGKYVSFIDSDDYIESQMYETMIDAIKSTNADIAMCGRYVVSTDYQKKTESFALENQEEWMEHEAKTRFLTTNKIDGSPCDKLFLKELFDKEGIRFPVAAYTSEDLLPIFKVVFNAKKIVHVGKCFYNYYQRSNSTSRGNFNEKYKGLLIYSEQIRTIVENEYSNYAELGDLYYANQLQNYLIVIDPKQEKNEYKKRRKELFEYTHIINKYANKTAKRNLLLLKLRLIHILLKLKTKMLHRK